MTQYETIIVEQRDRVGLITLNRPEALNALNSQLMREVVGAAEAFDRDPGIGCPGADRLRAGLRRRR
jgi:enoyl-CoA hydratase